MLDRSLSKDHEYFLALVGEMIRFRVPLCRIANPLRPPRVPAGDPLLLVEVLHHELGFRYKNLTSVYPGSRSYYAHGVAIHLVALHGGELVHIVSPFPEELEADG